MKIMIVDQFSKQELLVMNRLSPQEIEQIGRLSESLQGAAALFLKLMYHQAHLLRDMSEEEQKAVQYLLAKMMGVSLEPDDHPIDRESIDALLSHATTEPEYLTTLDVAKILGISPQLVRRYCQDGTIPAWRTLGNRGEWRIDVAYYQDHPGYRQFLRQRQEKQHATQQVRIGLKKLSSSENYEQLLAEIEQDRAKNKQIGDE
ncbi:MAG TPA: helix-turn-helix domain-containing protein [Bacilli bacterium]|nr:helix-turn-helix domain-containing protein [Bacilli bacterium]